MTERRYSAKRWTNDCTQETFLRLIRFYDTYVDKRKFKAWLFRIARLCAVSPATAAAMGEKHTIVNAKRKEGLIFRCHV